MSLQRLFSTCSQQQRETRMIRRHEDRVLAENIQRKEYEEERERQRMVKRNERRMWYEYYLEPWTFTVEDVDIFYAQPKDSSTEFETGPAQGAAQFEETEHECSEREDDDELSESIRLREGDLEKCAKEDPNAALHLRLPASTRVVDGTCACCLEEYKIGDEVVYSELQCAHAFHKECLMQWLAKGKKRCPMCRHWFVPGSRIEDQQESHGAAWQSYLAEQLERENEEDESQDTVPPLSPMPSRKGLGLTRGGMMCMPCDGEDSETSEMTDSMRSLIRSADRRVQR